MNAHNQKHKEGAGYPALLVALCWWGLMPLYYWHLKEVSAPEMLAHRVFWSFAVLSAVIGFRPALRRQMGGWRSFALALLPAVLLSANWVVYILASVTGNALQASLGYFLNPLLSAALGIVFLNERLNGLKAAALALGLAGTVVQCYAHGGVPVFAVMLTVTFSLLGLVRKLWPTKNAIVSTWRETVVMMPFALGYFAFLSSSHALAFTSFGASAAVLMMLAGPLTVVPLALYAYAMPLVSLTESAVMQYVTPTVTFALALMVFHERLTTIDLTGYGLIWCGLALATYATVRRRPVGSSTAAGEEASAGTAAQNVSFLAAHKKTPASAGVNRFWHSEGRPEPERRCEKSDA
ncbi:EamA family transporter RarD [Paraburkholderia diazotrophica]|uniref:Chloramphenicol-sensitive protein RarD n=1 Tax=Paraburkholderia diazotrophica TaxID=667676 RepID=A0A1H7E135_9BURK|nr:EamA family transporter RarD [Paraburkholderia diazotrophica]SEK07676.1 chloramphenicol-sensitive protein RarD [Paraburkholderia diazotrophica]